MPAFLPPDQDRPTCAVKGLPGEGPCTLFADWWVRMACQVSPLEQVLHREWGPICSGHLVSLVTLLGMGRALVCGEGHPGRPVIAEQRPVVPGQGPPPDVP